MALTTATNQQENRMGDVLKSRVPELVKKKGWTKQEFLGHCQLAGISWRTAYRLLEGETNFRMDTLEKLRDVFGVQSVSEIVDYR